MPNRIIKESINESRSLSELSPFAQDLFKRLITYADDYGRFNADIEIMRARLYPLEVDSVFVTHILDGLIDLCGIDKVRFYREPLNGHQLLRMYGYMPGWKNHQRIRDGRSKFPDPEEEWNDWALQRFVPIATKIIIFERDKFTCQHCRKSFQLKGLTTRQAMRALSSVFHIDHIVPVMQGGRATLENLRLLCSSCNLSRYKTFTFAELRDLAAGCGKEPLLSESESNSNLNPNPTLYPAPMARALVRGLGFDRFWIQYPKKRSKGDAEKAWNALKPDEQLQDRIHDALERAKTSADWRKDGGQYIPYPATWLRAKGWEDEHRPEKDPLAEQAQFLMGRG